MRYGGSSRVGEKHVFRWQDAPGVIILGGRNRGYKRDANASVEKLRRGKKQVDNN